MMHRARFLVNALRGPNGPKFASWLLAARSAAPALCTTATSPARCYSLPAEADPFLNGSSSSYIEDMYNAWLADPASVHPVSVL